MESNHMKGQDRVWDRGRGRWRERDRKRDSMCELWSCPGLASLWGSITDRLPECSQAHSTPRLTPSPDSHTHTHHKEDTTEPPTQNQTSFRSSTSSCHHFLYNINTITASYGATHRWGSFLDYKHEHDETVLVWKVKDLSSIFTRFYWKC